MSSLGVVVYVLHGGSELLVRRTREDLPWSDRTPDLLCPRREFGCSSFAGPETVLSAVVGRFEINGARGVRELSWAHICLQGDRPPLPTTGGSWTERTPGSTSVPLGSARQPAATPRLPSSPYHTSP